VYAVLLDGSRYMDEIFVDHGHKGDTMLCGEGTEELVEGLNVVRAVVGRQCNAGQQDLDMGGFQRGEHLLEIAAGLIERQAAETVVAAELDDYNLRMQAQNGRKAGDGVLGCGSAGALIHNLVVVALCVELPLQGVREGLAVEKAVAGGDTVAVADEHVRAGSQKRADKDQQTD